MEGYYVYILASGRNGTLYVGVTNDIARRIAEHRAGVADGFTKKYRVGTLVHVERYAEIQEAKARERDKEMASRVETGADRKDQSELDRSI